MRYPDSFSVSELYVSYRTEQKIIQKHSITVDEVSEAIEGVVGLRGRWDDDEERGLRMLVGVTIRGRPALIVLYPRDEPTEWNLGSAYFHP